jgi:hypothetical protein
VGLPGWLLGAGAVITVLCGAAAAFEQAPVQRAPGTDLVAHHRLPQAVVARYSALASGAGATETTRAHSMLADRAPWVGPEQSVGVGRNPYTLVLNVQGVARAAGEVRAQWQAGWDVRVGANAHREVVLALPTLAIQQVAAGQDVQLTARSAPVSFRGERSVAPLLGLVLASNLDVREVQIEIWSGSSPLLAASRGPWWWWAAALGALTLGGLGALRRRRAPLTAEPTAQRTVARGTLATKTPAPQPKGAAVAAAPAPPDHTGKVAEMLRCLLQDGLSVRSVPDDRHPPRHRRGR